jgi:RND family efflux transporter MFP subunit
LKPLLSLSFIALVLASCSRPEAEPSTLAEAPPLAPMSIATATVQARPMPRHLTFTGELQGARRATLATNVAGIVVDAPIERGTVLRKGDIVLKLDDRSAALAVQETEASLKDAELKLGWARDELKRSQALAKTNAISALEFDRLKLNFASAESTIAAATARRDTAKKTLSDMVLRAPFAGTIAERLTEAGEFVSTTKGVATIVATDTLRLVIHVPETEVASIQMGQTVKFTVPAFRDANFTGTVKHIGAALRDAARDLAIEAEVVNADGKLKPGMFAQGRVVLKEEATLAVPVKALRVDDTVRKLFVVKDGSIEERVVEVGESEGEVVEIRRGVEEGETVVLEPGADAADGMKVALATKL